MFAEKIGKRGEWYDHMQEQEAHGRKEGKHEISIETQLQRYHQSEKKISVTKRKKLGIQLYLLQ